MGLSGKVFEKLIDNLFEKLKLENQILKIENKILREFIIENGLRIPNEQIVENLPQQGEDKDGIRLFSEDSGDIPGDGV